MNLVRASEFATIAKVSRQLIYKMITDGVLDSVKKGRSVYLDLEGATCVEYLSRRQGQDTIMMDKPGPRPGPQIKRCNPVTDNPGPEIEATHPDGFISKREADRLKAIAQAAKINAELAAYIGELIDKDQVIKLFGKIHKVQSDLFVPMGERMAPLLAAICGIADPEITNAIKLKIDEEVSRGLEELKRIATAEI